jgi:hypothetical protein
MPLKTNRSGLSNFKRDAKDVFDLQKEISNIIAKRIEVTVTPEEVERINKRYTQNVIAYDFFLQGYEEINTGTREGFRAVYS